MRKRSVTIDGHRTSVSLEDPFWTELTQIAHRRGLSLAALVAEIDRAQIVRGKYDLDVVGHYARPDIFQLRVDERPKRAVTVCDADAAADVAAAAVYLKGAGDRGRIEQPILAKGWGLDAAYASFMGGPGRKAFDAVALFDRVVVVAAHAKRGRHRRRDDPRGQLMPAGSLLARPL